MKETMKQHLHAAERKTIQSMIRREYDGWQIGRASCRERVSSPV